MALIWKNQQHTYGWIHITLHWLSALMVFTLFGVGFYMMTLDYYDELYRVLPFYHKSFGFLFALLLIIRFCWRQFSPPPKPLGTHAWEALVAHIAHLLLYALMLAMVVSGYLISTADGRGISVFGLFELPATLMLDGQEDIAGLIHEYLAYTLIGLALIHAAAALKHRFIDKDETLHRMLVPLKLGETLQKDRQQDSLEDAQNDPQRNT